MVGFGRLLKKIGDYYRDLENRYQIRAEECRALRSSALFLPYMNRVYVREKQWKLNRNCLFNGLAKLLTPTSSWSQAIVLFYLTSSEKASYIVEKKILNHLLHCHGECVMVVVSENAAIKNHWLTTVDLRQYLVDQCFAYNQGFADIAMIVYLENFDGKWLAYMLFGQYQNKPWRSVMSKIDDMLSRF